MKYGKRLLALGLGLALALSLTACKEEGKPAQGADTDAVSAASEDFYGDSSYDWAELSEAIKGFRGVCMIATVNQDGTSNVSVAIPGVVGDCIAFGWADNATKSNLLRTGEASLCYYVYDAAAEGDGQYQGARMKVSLVTDEDKLAELAEENPKLASYGTFLQINELGPLG